MKGSIMNNLNLKIVYPSSSQMKDYFYNESYLSDHFKGDIRKNPTLEPDCLYYGFHPSVKNPRYTLYTDKNGKVRELIDYTRNNKDLKSVQKIQNIDSVQIKTTEILPFESGNESYKSIQRLDNETGLYSVTRQKGKKIIGGYEVNLKPEGRTFSSGFKGKLEKFALNIATDANDCERKGLRNIGEFLFKIARKIK